MKTLTVLVIGLFLVSISHGQTRVVRGDLTVFNEYAVQNVKVVSKKAKSSVTTDSLGHFELVCNEKDVIKIESPIFASVTKRVSKDDGYLSANLIFKDSPRNRKIATGMGYISEEHLNYALTYLEHENNDFCNYGDVFSLIKGKFPGVQVKVGISGEQGIFVRGTKSLVGENEATYMVDGIRVHEISFINPCEMISINILKDGAAAIYGSHGATGVVVIETKGSMN